MKKILIILIAGASLVACKSSDKKAGGAGLSKEQKEKALKDSANFTTIEWLDSTFKDLGKVKQGALVDVAFRFRNTGTKNLVIDDVTASCGCTVPEKPEKPFAPGEEGVIKAKFDSQGKHGEARKQVYVTANTKTANPQMLTFRVEITD